MTETVLPPGRREELLLLLEDHERLASEFPKLAEYLSAAPMLPGTGDDQADGQFDLRLVHHMTDTNLFAQNPYWTIVEPSISMASERRVVDGGRPEGSPRLAFAQTILQDVFSYAIPSPETIQWIKDFSDGKPVLEVGAGRGYWAAQLAHAGVSVTAFDISPLHPKKDPSAWYPVKGHAELKSIGEYINDCVLFLCWPPGWEDPMASEALATFERFGGKRLIYVGEPKGGKTANDRFFAALADRWHLSSSDTHFTSWWNLNDRAQAWIR